MRCGAEDVELLTTTCADMKTPHHENGKAGLVKNLLTPQREMLREDHSLCFNIGKEQLRTRLEASSPQC
jgi:hypothetical protein